MIRENVNLSPHNNSESLQTLLENPKPNNPDPETPSPSKDQLDPSDQNKPTADETPQKDSFPPSNNNPVPVLPPINTKEIIEAKDISQARSNAKKQIQALLQKSKLESCNLKKELQDWKSQLEKLDSKEEIIKLIEETRTEIDQKLKLLNSNNQTYSSPKPNFSPLCLTLIIGGGFLFASALVIYVIRRKKNKLKK